MKVSCAAAVILAWLAAPACAQSGHVPTYGEAAKEKSAAQIESDRAAQKAYNESLSNIPDKGPSDPWGNVRSESVPNKPARTAHSKRITPGSAAK